MWKLDYEATDGQTTAQVYKTNIVLTKTDGSQVIGTLNFISDTGSYWIKDDKDVVVYGADSATGDGRFGEEAFFYNNKNELTTTNSQVNETAYQNLNGESLVNTIRQSIDQVKSGLGGAKGTNPVYTSIGLNYILTESELFKSSVTVSSQPAPQADPDDPDDGSLTVDPDASGRIPEFLPPEAPPAPLTDATIEDREFISGKYKFLRYPFELDSNSKFHWMKIQTLEHEPQKFSEIPSLSEVIGSDEAARTRLSTENRYLSKDYDDFRVKYKALNTILLPMHPSISETNSVDWGGDSLNSIQVGAAGLASNLIQDLAAGRLTEAASNFGDEVRKTALNTAQNDSIRAALLSYFSGQAVGANLFGRTTGAVINPNLEVVFNGPRIRSFNYNFRFTPRDSRESEEVHNIISTFRKNMSVQQAKTALFLKAPNVFKITYMVQSEYRESGDASPITRLEELSPTQNPWLTKIKVCALTDMNVDYTPDGSYSTFWDDSPTAVGLTLSFTELEPVFANEYEFMETGLNTVPSY